MKWKTTLLILLLTLVGYFVVTYFKLFDNYYELICLLPIPNNIKRIIKYLDIGLTRNIKKPNIATSSSNNKPSRNVTPLQKKIVASNQSWKCRKCNSLLDYTYEIDHINPLYQGGGNNLENLQALCRNCHGKKTMLDIYS